MIQLHRYLPVLIFIFALGSVKKTCAQVVNKSAISEEVRKNNNVGNYEQTITLLEAVLSNTKSNSYQKYEAYYLKYLTYKRLFNYEKAKFNLNLALEEGLKSGHATQIAAQIKLEYLFIAFDLLKFDEVHERIKAITDHDLLYLTPKTTAFYFSILGTLELKVERYVEADEYFKKAISLLEKHDPTHLPLIYRKRIGLYRR